MTKTVPELMDMQTAKRRFGLKSGTLSKLVIDREVDSFLVDDRIKISVDSLNAYLERNRIKTDSQGAIVDGAV